MRHFSEISPAAERVLNVAELLIQLHGYNGFSYDDIAREIGIKKPSIHHHFATKAELVRVLVQRYTSRFGEALKAIELSSKDSVMCLFKYAELFAQTYEKERRLCVCGILGAEITALSEAVAQEVRLFFQLNLDWLTKIMREAVQAGLIQFSSNSPESHAYAFLSTLEGAMIVARGLGSNEGPAVAGRIYISNLLV